MIWAAFSQKWMQKGTHKWRKLSVKSTFSPCVPMLMLSLLLVVTLFIVLFRFFCEKLSAALLIQKIEHLFDSIMRLIVCNPNFYQIGYFKWIEPAYFFLNISLTVSFSGCMCVCVWFLLFVLLLLRRHCYQMNNISVKLYWKSSILWLSNLRQYIDANVIKPTTDSQMSVCFVDKTERR